MAETKDLSFIDDIKELEAMPKISRDLMVMLQTPSRSIREVVDKIQLDPALTTFILKTANSPFYGIKQELRTIHAAVTMLGFSEIRSILMSYFLRHLYFSSGKSDVMDYLWEHSISVAAFAKELSSYLKLKEEEAYLAGLLHDIGKLVIHFFDPEAYEKILKKGNQEGGDSITLEEEAFRFTHSDTGHYLASKWNLSDLIKNTILFHHYFISYTGNEPVIGIVAFANQLVHKYIEQKPVDLDIYLKKYNVTHDELDFFAEETIGMIEKYHLMLPLQHSKKETPLPEAKEEKSFVSISSSAESKPVSKSEGTVQPPVEEIKVEEEQKYSGDPSFGVPTIELEEAPRPEPKKDLKAEISKETLVDGVKLYVELDKTKKQLLQLKETYDLFDKVPVKVLQNLGQMLKLFSESIPLLLKDPEMSSILKVAKSTKERAAKESADKKTGS